jgi:hypothetical protein
VTPSFGQPVAGYKRPAIFSPAIDLIVYYAVLTFIKDIE